MWMIQIVYYKFSYHLHTFTSFLFLAFPSTPTTFPYTFICQQSILQSTLQPFTQVLIQSEPWDVLSSSRDVLGSHAVYLAPQLLLWTVFLVFPHPVFPWGTPTCPCDTQHVHEVLSMSMVYPMRPCGAQHIHRVPNMSMGCMGYPMCPYGTWHIPVVLKMLMVYSKCPWGTQHFHVVPSVSMEYLTSQCGTQQVHGVSKWYPTHP